jgi:integrase
MPSDGKGRSCGFKPARGRARASSRLESGATKHAAKWREGVNPNTKKLTDRIEATLQAEAVIAADAAKKAADKTLRDLFNAWIADGVRRKDENAELRRSFARDILPSLDSTPLRLVTDTDLSNVLRAIVSRGANRVAVLAAADIKQLFRWGEKRQPWRRLLADGNPAALIDVEPLLDDDYDAENVRERALSEDEVKELYKALARSVKAYEKASRGHKYEVPRPLKETTRYALWICLGTMSRIGETLMAEWCHVDFAERTWRIPAENTKGARKKKRELNVYMSDFVVAQFKALQTLTGTSRWVFPAKQNGDAHVDLKSVTKQIGGHQVRFQQRTRPLIGRREDNSLVLADGKNGKWTPHDLRRTGSTLMQKLNIHADDIDRCQNHKLPGATKVRKTYQQH